MSCASDKLISVMMDSVMLLVAHVNDSIVRTKAICMQCCREFHFAPNNGLNAGLFTVRDDLGVNTTIAFVDTEDNGLASRSTSALAANSARTKVRFIQFDVARKRRLSLTMQSNSLANKSKIT